MVDDLMGFRSHTHQSSFSCVATNMLGYMLDLGYLESSVSFMGIPEQQRSHLGPEVRLNHVQLVFTHQTTNRFGGGVQQDNSQKVQEPVGI